MEAAGVGEVAGAEAEKEAAEEEAEKEEAVQLLLMLLMLLAAPVVAFVEAMTADMMADMTSSEDALVGTAAAKASACSLSLPPRLAELRWSSPSPQGCRPQRPPLHAPQTVP